MATQHTETTRALAERIHDDIASARELLEQHDLDARPDVDTEVLRRAAMHAGAARAAIESITGARRAELERVRARTARKDEIDDLLADLQALGSIVARTATEDGDLQRVGWSIHDKAARLAELLPDGTDHAAPADREPGFRLDRESFDSLIEGVELVRRSWEMLGNMRLPQRR
jgi:hypothetical protein